MRNSFAVNRVATAVAEPVTSVLFLLGKFVIGYYLGYFKISATYGTAASIVILMLWIYYSSIILYFGACYTSVYADYQGHPIRER